MGTKPTDKSLQAHIQCKISSVFVSQVSAQQSKANLWHLEKGPKERDFPFIPMTINTVSGKPLTKMNEGVEEIFDIHWSGTSKVMMSFCFVFFLKPLVLPESLQGLFIISIMGKIIMLVVNFLLNLVELVNQYSILPNLGGI